jgi:hypothetical protein
MPGRVRVGAGAKCSVLFSAVPLMRALIIAGEPIDFADVSSLGIYLSGC